jgi:hypothetical protein
MGWQVGTKDDGHLEYENVAARAGGHRCALTLTGAA